MRMCNRPGCHKLYGHKTPCATWDAEAQKWKPLPPTEREQRHAETVRAESERQNQREGRARRITDDVLQGSYDGRRLASGSQLGHALVRSLMERAALAAMTETETAR